MTMDKERAIECAYQKAKKSNRPHFVIWEPELYRDIFENKGYKVVDDVYLADLQKQGYSTEALVCYATASTQ